MERLEPILKQKFWILLGVGIVMTITGWWLATSALAKTIADRTTAVDGAFKMIPSGEIPNDKWSQQLAARNGDQEKAVNRTRALLWNRQLGRMTWNPAVYPHVWQNGYRGEIALPGREIYRTEYANDVRRVWESARPFITQDGSGIVYFGQNEKALPQKSWGRLAPSSAEMWDAQEDLWLLESLLRAIVDVNGGVKGTRGDASIHMIEKISLHGGVASGQRKSSTPTAGPGGPGGPGPGGAHGSGPSAAFGGMSSASAGGESSRAQQGPAPADFDPKEEFGDDGSGRAGGGLGPMGNTAMSGSAGPAAGHSGPGGPGAGGAGAAANSVRRYIDDDAALPFKTRGFYMTLVMDHQKIPSLISELTASDKSAWPVDIVRVQMVRTQDNDIDSRGGASGSGYGPMAGGSRSPLALPTIGGTGPGFPGSSDSESISAPPASETTTDGANPDWAAQAAAATAALQNSMQDPFIARVSICGIITLYKEVKPEPVAATTTNSAATQGTPATGTNPANPAATADPAAATNPTGTPAADPKAAPEEAGATNDKSDKPGTEMPEAEKPETDKAEGEKPAARADPAKPASGEPAPAAPAPKPPNG